MPSTPKTNDVLTHFVTTNVSQNEWIFTKEKFCQILIDNLKFYRDKYQFELLAYVIIPWHIHLLINLLEETKIQDVMRDFKKYTAIQIVQELTERKEKKLLSKFSLGEELSVYKYSLGRKNFEGYPGSEDPGLPGRGMTTGSAASSDAARSKRKYQIWQPDFYDFNIYSGKKLWQKINYIHYNPVKHNLVKDPKDWKYSSYHNWEYDNHSIIKLNL